MSRWSVISISSVRLQQRPMHTSIYNYNSTKGEVSSKAQKDKRTNSERNTSNLFFLRCFHHLFETNRISPAFFFTIDCEAKNVNYKKTPSFPNAGSESGDWYPTSAPGMLVLVSFLDFFCSPLKRLANSLVAVLVSEWCSMWNGGVSRVWVVGRRGESCVVW